MAEFIEACTQSPVNLVFSIMLLMIALFWIVVLLGAAGMESLDFDFDTDFDADVDADAGFLEAGVAGSVLKFFHIGTVPVSILLSVFVLGIWAVGVLSYPFIGSWGIVLQLLMVIPFFIVGIVITKIVTLPLKTLFEKMEAQTEAEQHVDLIGKRCKVVSLSVTDHHGQVEVATEGAPLRLNCHTTDPHLTLNKGDEAVIISQDEATHAYIVRGF